MAPKARPPKKKEVKADEPADSALLGDAHKLFEAHANEKIVGPFVCAIGEHTSHPTRPLTLSRASLVAVQRVRWQGWACSTTQ